ncbi:MAG: ribonuclease H-like domain-containing protein [Anaerolineaceae bacterium]
MDMESLAEKLKSMGVKLGTQAPPPPPAASSRTRIEDVVAGEVIRTIYGEVFVSTQTFPLGHLHGSTHLDGSISLNGLLHWGRISLDSNLVSSDFVFMDTETTGLAGGTGTVPFMVGVGRFTSENFILSQFFMRDPTEEPALLAAVNEFYSPCRGWVTFNGKTFDAPLLNTRYTLHGITSPLPGAPHLDLLPLARRLWRDRLPSRSLGYLETSILGLERTQEEVPGWMIPQMYFDYLHSGDANPILGVFYHNANDILSLAALFQHTANLLDHPLSMEIPDGLDVIALARLFEDLGDLETAVLLYEQGLSQGLPEEFFWRTVERFAAMQKRIGEWQSSCALWEKAAQHGDISAQVELAKYHEHQSGDLTAALRWTEEALNTVTAPGASRVLRYQWEEDLRRRQQRLLKKCKEG